MSNEIKENVCETCKHFQEKDNSWGREEDSCIRFLQYIQDIECDKCEHWSISKELKTQYYAQKLAEKDDEIRELESELKTISGKDFCYDLQEWVKSVIVDIDGFNNYYSYQCIRQAVYSEMVADGRTPTWGDKSYYRKEFATRPVIGHRTTEKQLEKKDKAIQSQQEEIENLKKCLNYHRNVMIEMGGTSGCLWKMTCRLLGIDCTNKELEEI